MYYTNMNKVTSKLTAMILVINTTTLTFRTRYDRLYCYIVSLEMTRYKTAIKSMKIKFCGKEYDATFHLCGS